MIDFDITMQRIKNLAEYEVQVTVPETFSFRGKVPWDMQILGNQAFVTVIASSLTEARSRVEEYFNFKEE
jgi:transcriptional regulator of nitric oxide reductase